MMTVFTVTASLLSLGCGSTAQSATDIIYDAKLRVEAAKAADAQSLAPQTLADAEQMLARSEEMLSAGKETEAYRLGMRAQLKARIAEAVAVANQMEAKADSANGTLELKLKAAETAHRELKQAEQELEQLQATPEQ